jgi:hypothetical protein
MAVFGCDTDVDSDTDPDRGWIEGSRGGEGGIR